MSVEIVMKDVLRMEKDSPRIEVLHYAKQHINLQTTMMDMYSSKWGQKKKPYQLKIERKSLT